MDAALKILSSAVDPKDQLTAMVAVQKAYVAGLPEIPLYYRAETTGVGVHMGNWPGYNPSSIGPTWDVEDWFFQ
jgi:ABC-type transport system substrate-binding protein